MNYTIEYRNHIIWVYIYIKQLTIISAIKKVEGIDHILVYVDVAVLGSTPARTGNSLNE